MILPWSAALAAQAILAWRLPPGPVRQLHVWQAASGLGLMALRWQAPEWYGWAWACWWPLNAAMLAYACRGRSSIGVSLFAWLLLLAVAAGSSVHFDRDLVQVYSLRWLISTIAISYWLGAAFVGAYLRIGGVGDTTPDEFWMFNYALLSFGNALAGAWVWSTWPALYVAQQLAQVILFSIWASRRT